MLADLKLEQYAEQFVEEEMTSLELLEVRPRRTPPGLSRAFSRPFAPFFVFARLYLHPLAFSCPHWPSLALSCSLSQPLACSRNPSLLVALSAVRAITPHPRAAVNVC
eukprot:1877152-Pleurochrysis_carterae.AAC.12